MSELAAPKINKRQKEVLHSDDVKVEQRPDVVIVKKNHDPREPLEKLEREPEVVEAGENVLEDKAYTDELAFMEQEVIIRLEPSTEKNSPTVFPIWVNGKGCELKGADGRWYEVAWVPVGMDLTTKRKYLEVVVRAKIDTIETEIVERPTEDPENKIKRFTSPLHSFSIIHDPDPRGPAWIRELRRRAM